MENGKASGLIHLGVLVRGPVPSGMAGIVALRQLQGMSVAARAHRATLHTEYLLPGEFDRLSEPSAWPPILSEGVVSGVALLSDLLPASANALTGKFPCVQFFAPAAGTSIDCVTDDSMRSMGQLIAYLIGLGHRKVGLADFGYATPSQRVRFAGYVKTLTEFDIAYDAADAHFTTGHPTHEERIERVADRVTSRARDAGVRAWICTDDYLGYTLVGALLGRGIRVPRDVSICGFDNFDPPPDLPKLTSIEAPFEKMGAVGVRRLVQRITEPGGEPEHLMLGCRLVVGQSTGPAPR